MRIAKALLLLALIGPHASRAGGGGPGGGFAGATEITQIANNSELVLSYVEQAQQTVTQLNQYAAMLRNLQRLTPSSLLATSSQQLWANQSMDSSFRNLYRITVGGQRIAYSLQSLDAQMRSINPGYGQYASFDYQRAYRNWSDTTRGAITSAMQVTSAQGDDFQSESDMISELSRMSNSVDGQVQAVQAGNQIGIAMIGQMQKLRQIQMAQVQAQQIAALAAQGRKDAADNIAQQFLNNARAGTPRPQPTPDLFR